MEQGFDDYSFKTNCAKAKTLLILKWMMVGFLLSNGYRSVLLSTLVSPIYEKPIDTIQDLLDTERPIFSDHPTFLLMMRLSALKSLRDLGTKIENMVNATEISMR